MIPQFLRALFNALIQNQLVYRVYPRTNDATLLAGVAVASGKSLAMGAWVQLFAAATITTDFWLSDFSLDTQDAADILYFQAGTGAGGAEVYLTDMGVVDAIAIAAGAVPFRLSLAGFGRRIAANARLAARSAANSANVRTWNAHAGVYTGVLVA